MSKFRLPNGRVIEQINPPETSLQFRNIFTNKCYLRNGISLCSKDVVFDVGANVGLASLYFHWLIDDIEIYSFEPYSIAFAALQQNYTAYNIRGKAINCGLGNRNSLEYLKIYPQATAMASFYADFEQDLDITRRFLRNSGFLYKDIESLTADRGDIETERCNISTFSQWWSELKIKSIGLLKINVERAEHDVLEGIADECWPHIRQIVMQIHDIDNRVEAVQNDLKVRGYTISISQDPLLTGTEIYELVAIRQEGKI